MPGGRQLLTLLSEDTDELLDALTVSERQMQRNPELIQFRMARAENSLVPIKVRVKGDVAAKLRRISQVEEDLGHEEWLAALLEHIANLQELIASPNTSSSDVGVLVLRMLRARAEACKLRLWWQELEQRLQTRTRK
jgi:hypothetical protein